MTQSPREVYLEESDKRYKIKRFVENHYHVNRSGLNIGGQEVRNIGDHIASLLDLDLDTVFSEKLLEALANMSFEVYRMGRIDGETSGKEEQRKRIAGLVKSVLDELGLKVD